jgi:hypothetical protein
MRARSSPAFQQFILPDAGGLVFLAKVAGTNITSANNSGLWAVDGGGVVQLVAQRGGVISVNGADKKLKTITLFAKTPFSAGQSRSFTTDGASPFPRNLHRREHRIGEQGFWDHRAERDHL